MKRLLPLLVLPLVVVPLGLAQLPKLRVPSLPGMDSLFKKGPAITTSLADAKWAAPDKDDFDPSTKSLDSLKRGPSGGFILEPGAYKMTVQSYCLHAGTHGPGGGDAYLYAPPKGPAEKAVIAVVTNSVAHPEIQQHDVQLLLWAIVAREKVSDLPSNLQVVAAALLTPKQIVDLNGGAMQILGEEAMNRGLIKEPPLVQQAYEAENRLRSALSSPTATYEEMERIAVLTGDAPRGPGSVEVPRGRWSLVPDGFYVRYLPNSYTNTVLEIDVPEGCPAIGHEFNPATHIATPCDTARQRLIQSARPFGR